jgi:hypothetical protein
MSLPQGIAVQCPDPAVRVALEAWLAGLRLSVSTRLVLNVEISEQESAPLGETLFEQPEVRFGPGPNGRGVRVVWDHAPALAELPAGATVASVRLSANAVARLDRCTRTFLLAVVILLLRRVGWYHLHAATAIDPGGQGWLFTGNAHVGKSTTAALLATSGWQVGTDDAAFLERVADRIRVHTVHAPIALREGGRRLLAKAGGIVLHDRGKVGFWPEDLGAVWTPLVSPDIVIFPTVGRTRTTAQPIARAEALAELVRWSAWVMLEPDLAQAHLDVLAQLAGQARCYRVTLGRDLFARPNRLIELVT